MDNIDTRRKAVFIASTGFINLPQNTIAVLDQKIDNATDSQLKNIQASLNIPNAFINTVDDAIMADNVEELNLANFLFALAQRLFVIFMTNDGAITDVETDTDTDTEGEGLKPKKKTRFLKGSQEAKDFMASIRAKKGGSKPAEMKKENIKMAIIEKKPIGRKAKYATEEERKEAKKQQTLASNKKKRAEIKGKGGAQSGLAGTQPAGIITGNPVDTILELLTDEDILRLFGGLFNEGSAVNPNLIYTLGTRRFQLNDEQYARMRLRIMELRKKVMKSPKKQPSIYRKRLFPPDPDAEGTGIFDDISNTIKKTYNTVIGKTKEVVGKTKEAVENTFNSAVGTTKQAVKSVKQYANVVVKGRNDYPPKVRKILSELGSRMVSSAVVMRTPVPSVLTGALNAVSFGAFSRNFKNAPYDTLFHLSLVLDLQGGTRLLIEKNEVINMDKNPSTPPQTDVQAVPNVPTNVSVNEILQKAQDRMGGKYFGYSARDNNCQDYIMAILQANNMGDDATFQFVKQDTKQLFEGLTTLRKISNTVTDLGAKVNEITTGAGAGGRIIYPRRPPVIREPELDDEELRYRIQQLRGAMGGTNRRIASIELQIQELITNPPNIPDADIEARVQLFEDQIEEGRVLLHNQTNMIRHYEDLLQERIGMGFKNNISNNSITIMPRKTVKGGKSYAGDVIDTAEDLGNRIRKVIGVGNGGNGLYAGSSSGGKGMCGGNVNRAQMARIFSAYPWFNEITNQAFKQSIVDDAVGVINNNFGGDINNAIRQFRILDAFIFFIKGRHIEYAPVINQALMGKLNESGLFSGDDITRGIGKGLYAGASRNGRGVHMMPDGTMMRDDMHMSGGAIATQNGVMFPNRTVIHYYGGHSMQGDGILDDISRAFSPRAIEQAFQPVAQAFQPQAIEQAFQPVAQAFKPVAQAVKNIVPDVEKLVKKEVKQRIVNPARKAFSPGGSAEKLGKKTASTLIHKGIPLVAGYAGSTIGNTLFPESLGVAGLVGNQIGKKLGKMGADELGKATGYGVARKGRFAKGSQEAKDYMASIRAKKKV